MSILCKRSLLLVLVLLVGVAVKEGHAAEDYPEGNPICKITGNPANSWKQYNFKYKKPKENGDQGLMKDMERMRQVNLYMDCYGRVYDWSSISLVLNLSRYTYSFHCALANDLNGLVLKKLANLFLWMAGLDTTIEVGGRTPVIKKVAYPLKPIQWIAQKVKKLKKFGEKNCESTEYLENYFLQWVQTVMDGAYLIQLLIARPLVFGVYEAARAASNLKADLRNNEDDARRRVLRVADGIDSADTEMDAYHFIHHNIVKPANKDKESRVLSKLLQIRSKKFKGKTIQELVGTEDDVTARRLARTSQNLNIPWLSSYNASNVGLIDFTIAFDTNVLQPIKDILTFQTDFLNEYYYPPLAGLSDFFSPFGPALKLMADLSEILGKYSCESFGAPSWACDLDGFLFDLMISSFERIGIDVFATVNLILEKVGLDMPTVEEIEAEFPDLVPGGFTPDAFSTDLMDFIDIDSMLVDPFDGMYDESGRTDLTLFGVDLELRMASKLGGSSLDIICDSGTFAYALAAKQRTVLCMSEWEDLTPRVLYPCGSDSSCTLNVGSIGSIECDPDQNPDPWPFFKQYDFLPELNYDDFRFQYIEYTCITEDELQALAPMPLMARDDRGRPSCSSDFEAIATDRIAYDWTIDGGTGDQICDIDVFDDSILPTFCEYRDTFEQKPYGSLSNFDFFEDFHEDRLEHHQNDGVSDADMDQFAFRHLSCWCQRKDLGCSAIANYDCELYLFPYLEYMEPDGFWSEEWEEPEYIPNYKTQRSRFRYVTVDFNREDCRDYYSSCDGGQSCFMIACQYNPIYYACLLEGIDTTAGGDLFVEVAFGEARNKLTLAEPDCSQFGDGAVVTIVNMETGRGLLKQTVANYEEYCVDQVSCSLSQSDVGYEDRESLRVEYECRCTAGFYLFRNETTGICDPLPGGVIRPSHLLTEESCKPGTYSEGRATECLECQAGTFAKDYGSSGCEPCPSGTFQGNTGQSSCTEAPANSFVASTASTTYEPCPAGTEAPNPGSPECGDVEYGFFSGVGTGSIPCSPGTYADQLASTECLECPPGFFSSQGGAAQCDACPVNTYAEGNGNTECVLCPEGTYTKQVGATLGGCLARETFDFSDPQYENMTCQEILVFDLDPSDPDFLEIQEQRFNQTGNGMCNGLPWNTKQCQYDGGDCCPHTCETPDYDDDSDQAAYELSCHPSTFYCLDPGVAGTATSATDTGGGVSVLGITCDDLNLDLVRKLSSENTKGYKSRRLLVAAAGNGFCDPELNNEKNGYDGGDCCWQTCQNNPGVLGDCIGPWDLCIDPQAFSAQADINPPTLIGVNAMESLQVAVDSVPPIPIVSANDDDPCFDGAVVFEESRLDGSCPNEFSLRRSWKATDPANNVADATQTIQVVDSNLEMPEIGARYCFDTQPRSVFVELDLLGDSHYDLLSTQADCGSSPPEYCNGTIASTLDLVSCVSNQRNTSRNPDGDCYITEKGSVAFYYDYTSNEEENSHRIYTLTVLQEDVCQNQAIVDYEFVVPNTLLGSPGCTDTIAELQTFADPGVMDDPHVRTWNGTYFDFMGECDVVMIHDPVFYHGTSLDIHLRLTIRYDYSYIESAALRIGDDILEVTSFGEYALNGIDHAELDGMDLDGFPIYYSHPNSKEHVFDVLIGPGAYITLSTFKDLVSVRIHHGTRAYFGQSSGIMGSFDGKLLARDGKTIIDDPNQFGQEWQVHQDEPKLFQSLRAPQHPEQKCKLPTDEEFKAKQKRRLEGSKELAKVDAERACDHLTGEAKRNACIFDVMMVGDVDIAKATEY